MVVIGVLVCHVKRSSFLEQVVWVVDRVTRLVRMGLISSDGKYSVSAMV